MTSAQVVETSVKVTPNSPSQDYSHPDDHNLRTYDMTPDFKPFTVGNNWMRKIPRTAKLAVWQSEEFFESNYFQIGQACSPITY